MGKQFDVVYDDFTGGHFVGPVKAKQARDTWTGQNVVCTADEGYLMADGGWTQSDLVVNSGSNRSAPVYARLFGSSLANDFGIVFSVGSNLYTVSSSGSASAGVALGFTPASGSHIALTDNGAVLGGTTATAAHVDLSSGTVTPSTPAVAPSHGMWKWKDWVLHLSLAQPSRVYYSDAGTFGTWTATNYYTVGTGSNIIDAIVVTNDQVMLGTRQGWWSLSGVLGSSATIRQVSKIGTLHDPSSPTALAAAESAVLGLVGQNGLDSIVASAGRLTTTVHHGPVRFPGVPSPSGTVNAGTHHISNNSTYMWVWSELHRRWRLSALSGVGAAMPVENTFGWTDNLYVVGIFGSNNTYVYRQPEEPVQPVQTGTAFDSATVTLADYNADRPFRVRELLIEVDYGTPATQTAPRSIAAKVLTHSQPDLPSTFDRDPTTTAVAPPSSSTFTWQRGDAQATKNGDREMIRFGVSDGIVTYSAAPRITMAGVKIRRVIMRCAEES